MTCPHGGSCAKMTAERRYCVIRWLIPGNWNALTGFGKRALRRLSVGIYKGAAWVLVCTDSQSRKTTLRRELCTFKPPLYSMNPSFRNLFMKKFTRERVVPTISASVSWETRGNVR